MIVGICSVELNMDGILSLKEKRRIIKSIIDKTKSRFNVAIAEVDYHDFWQRAKIGFCVVGNSSNVLDSYMKKVLLYIDNLNLAEMISQEIEFINF